MMNQWEPMWMQPVFKETVWGGRQIAAVFGKEIPSEHTGEAWEVAAHDNGKSVILTGKMAGKNLQQAIEEEPEAILGSAVFKKYGKHFPLLIKLIDAADRLSVQVHPNDEEAKRLEGPGENGKTEMWYVIDAKPGAQLIYGVNRPVTPQEFADAVKSQTLDQIVNWVPVHKGDTFFIPAGTLHAIGAGILIAEIQQNSDTTYRVYDYGRIGLDGKPRALHTEKAKQVTCLTPRYEAVNIDDGVCCPYFQTYRRKLQGQQEISVSKEHFQILMMLEGSAVLAGRPFKEGDTVLLPAAAGTVQLEGSAVYLQIL